ncbi:hypothetical protein SAMN00768000_1987 [Sulfobacillus thermosulfidooxidans DSM 9293]|uniref:Uncharacterized protein n=1 Tax=Sulfobacillus thermosulfidooxidans (strain DSM 9293 / VKM B-1269 / AT-1) TaxID=929705 RepID=A0A1W1WH21_SULTA|nr:hypothetical protein [Sulfobacillus thermosulfidooxidans]SMC05033.1 hypothetical protein SAMN00768000_1987 [Sulfobacillus thermosulfidooxidans DSM 9293]
MGFFKSLRNAMEGTSSAQNLPDHMCQSCQIAMEYRGPHALRTGGLNRGWGVAADVLLGARDEAFFDQLTEKNIIVHVFVCPDCGRIEMINDPRRGF